MRHYTILAAMLTCIAFFCTPPAHSRDNRYYRIEPVTGQKFFFDDSPQPQLTALLNAYIDNTAKDGELLFQFRRFNFVERYDTSERP